MVKDFSWNIVPWIALLFEKTLKQLSIVNNEIYGFILNKCPWHGETCGYKVWVFLLFSPDSDDRLSVNFHRFIILYKSCDTRSVGLLDNTVYRKCPMALKSHYTVSFANYCCNWFLNCLSQGILSTTGKLTWAEEDDFKKVLSEEVCT